MMAERGVTVSYESVREWCLKFGGAYTKRIRSRRGRLGDRWHLDEVFLRINGKLQYLCSNTSRWALGVCRATLRSSRLLVGYALAFSLIVPGLRVSPEANTPPT